MDLIDILKEIEYKIFCLKLKRTKKVFLNCKDIQKLMLENKPIPTNIFNAEKRDYIVKVRTIFGPKTKR